MPCVVKARAPRKNPKSCKKPPFPPLPLPCLVDGCPWSYPRAYDLRCHSLTHMCPEEHAKHMHRCKVEGCSFQTLQASNLKTHVRTHTGGKPEMCDGCTYTTGDPASLTAHRKKVHGYTPQAATLLKPDGHATAPLQMANGYVSPPSHSYSVPSSASLSCDSSSSSSSSSPGSVYSDRSPESWGVSSSSYASAYSSHGPSSGYSAYSSAGSLNLNFAYLSSIVAP
ncbi:hypothetical protein K438DRAFT_258101 [Mycena galopus ATCC 62051]|nr:hypothetical protein K438DRAFT_258101 [Mycena galopus ATCC 62051]